VATAGQTSVSGVDANGLTLAYVAGSEAVYVNGALQVRGQDYTATNGTSITGLTALAVNDVVEIFAYTAFTVANAYTKSETDGIAAAAPGMRLIVPTSVAVNSGSGSVGTAGTITFSGASTISVNGCFTSTYDNYYIEIDFSVPSTGGDTGFRLRSSGTDKATNYATKGTFLNAASPGDYGSGTTTLFYVSNTTATNLHLTKINVSRPAISGQTTIMADTVGSNDNRFLASGRQTETTTFDGFTFYNVGSNNMTGSIHIYGLKD
jgi:hypothetical protein